MRKFRVCVRVLTRNAPHSGGGGGTVASQANSRLRDSVLTGSVFICSIRQKAGLICRTYTTCEEKAPSEPDGAYRSEYCSITASPTATRCHQGAGSAHQPESPCARHEVVTGQNREKVPNRVTNSQDTVPTARKSQKTSAARVFDQRVARLCATKRQDEKDGRHRPRHTELRRLGSGSNDSRSTSQPQTMFPKPTLITSLGNGEK